VPHGHRHVSSLTVTQLITLYQMTPESPIDALRTAYGSTLDRLQETHRVFSLKPSLKDIAATARSCAESFVSIEDARDHYGLFCPGWGYPGWPTPVEALMVLTIEAISRSVGAAMRDDWDTAIPLYLESQAYLSEFEINASEFKLRQAEGRRAATERARANRWSSDHAEQKTDLIRRSLAQVANAHAFRPDTPPSEVLLALQHFLESQAIDVGFDPYDVEEHLRHLFANDRSLVAEFSSIAGISLPLIN